MNNERTHDEALRLYHAIMADIGAKPNHLLHKSSLYHRLLSGKDALVIPPPCAWSYPWYEVIESDSTLHIEEPLPYADDQPPHDAVSIFQTLWSVISREDDQLRLTYPGWDALGFEWRIWRERVSADESPSKLLCHHDPKKKYLATKQDLQAESLYHAEKWREELSIVANHDDEDALRLLADTVFQEDPNKSAFAEWLAQDDTKQALRRHRGTRNKITRDIVIQGNPSKSPSSKWFAKAYAQQTLARRKETLKERTQQGLSEVPSDDEIEKQAKHQETILTRNGWWIMDGLLYCNTWKMKRVSPEKVNKAHYLDSKTLT